MLTRLKFIGIAGLLLIGIACKKSSDSVTTYTGKIIFMRCGTAVIQIDGAAGNGGGTTYASAGFSYTNAATIGNYCYIAGLGIRSGDIVSFKTVGTNPQPNATCIVELCVATTQQPTNVIYVTDMVKTGP